MSYLTQMAGLAWHNFTSAAAGIGVALALARGLTRQPGPAGAQDDRQLLGRPHPRHRSTCCCPLSFVGALVPRLAGRDPEPSRPTATSRRSRARSRSSRMGPVASQEAIKELGTNGGGFFNANSAHPFENPTPLTNFLEMVLIFAIPAALTYTYGRMARNTRQGWAHLRGDGRAVPRGRGRRLLGRSRHEPGAGVALPWITAAGNMEGKEVRFGIANSALFATVTTDASCGAVNSMHDSFTPLGGLVPLAQHPARRGDLRRRRRRSLRHARLRAPRGLHRRPHGRPHARVPRQEDRGARDEARDALRPRSSRSSILGFAAWAVGRALRRLVAQQRRAARPLRDPLRVHERHRQQRLGLRRPQRQHPVLERHPRPRDAHRPLPHDRPGPRHRGLDGGQEDRARRARGPSRRTARSSRRCCVA